MRNYLAAQAGIWVPAGRTKDTHLQVDNLQKGHLYKFRVKAVNKEGASDPLETDSAIVAKNPFGEWQNSHLWMWLNS